MAATVMAPVAAAPTTTAATTVAQSPDLWEWCISGEFEHLRKQREQRARDEEHRQLLFAAKLRRAIRKRERQLAAAKITTIPKSQRL